MILQPPVVKDTLIQLSRHSKLLSSFMPRKNDEIKAVTQVLDETPVREPIKKNTKKDVTNGTTKNSSKTKNSSFPLHGFTPTENSPVAPNGNNNNVKSSNDEIAKRLRLELVASEKALQHEKKFRHEIEQAARKIFAKFKKVKFELQNEQSKKQELLNHAASTESKVNLLESQIHYFEFKLEKIRKEKHQKAKRLKDTFNDEKEELLSHHRSLLEFVENEKLSLEQDNTELKDKIFQLEDIIKDLQENFKTYANEHEKEFQTNVDSIKADYESLAFKYEQTLSELNEAKFIQQQREQEIHNLTTQSQKYEQTAEQEILFYHNLCENLKSDIENYKTQLQTQRTNVHSTLQKVKGRLLHMRKERDALQTMIDSCKQDKTLLCTQKQDLERKCESLEKEILHLKDHLENNLLNTTKQHDETGREIECLRKTVSSLETEKQKLKSVLQLMKSKIISYKHQVQDEKSAADKQILALRNEISSTQDNIKIIQKISEDQGRTINKLRSDLDQCKKDKTALEQETRERHHEESVILRKLDHERHKSRELEDKIESLEGRLVEYETEMRNHCCEENVDSQWKSKLNEVESTLKSNYDQWQRSIEQLKKERDAAVAAARKTSLELEAMKANHEVKMVELKSMMQKEKCRMQDAHSMSVSESQSKIFELQSQLESTKLKSQQIERTLSSKISQLQNALSACIGGMNSSFVAASPMNCQNGNSSFGSFTGLGTY